MSQSHLRHRPFRLLLIGLTIAGCAFVTPQVAAEDDDIQIISVTEEWEMKLGEPNLEENGPQVLMVMSPNNHLDDTYFGFSLNFRQWPSYSPGGLQVQRFDGEVVQDFSCAAGQQQIESNNETIRWKQQLKLENGSLEFQVLDGQSTSWGSFGGNGSLRLTQSTGMQSLSNYTPLLSTGESGVGFAGNRVQSLRLLKVVFKISTGEEFEVKAPFDIDTDLDPWN